MMIVLASDQEESNSVANMMIVLVNDQEEPQAYGPSDMQSKTFG